MQYFKYERKGFYLKYLLKAKSNKDKEMAHTFLYSCCVFVKSPIAADPSGTKKRRLSL